VSSEELKTKLKKAHGQGTFAGLGLQRPGRFGVCLVTEAFTPIPTFPLKVGKGQKAEAYSKQISSPFRGCRKNSGVT